VYHIAVALATLSETIFVVPATDTTVSAKQSKHNLFTELFIHSLWITFGPGPRCLYTKRYGFCPCAKIWCSMNIGFIWAAAVPLGPGGPPRTERE